MSVNEKIRLIRETKGLTQEQLAEKLGISPTAYGDIERGDNDPKLSKLQKLAEIFEMSLTELLDLGERGSINISFNRLGKQSVLISGSIMEKELALKDKEIAMQAREIENLREIIALLKREPPQPKPI